MVNSLAREFTMGNILLTLAERHTTIRKILWSFREKMEVDLCPYMNTIARIVKQNLNCWSTTSTRTMWYARNAIARKFAVCSLLLLLRAKLVSTAAMTISIRLLTAAAAPAVVEAAAVTKQRLSGLAYV